MVDRVTSRRRRANGFLGMIALIVAVEVGVGSRRDLVDPVGLEWRNGARAIRTRSKHAEVLCLGDSMMKYGIAAPVLEARLGVPVANFAASAAPASTSYFALAHAIEAGARPRLVLVDYAPFLLLPGYRLNRQYLAEAASLLDALDLAWSAEDGELGGSMVLSQFVPTVRNRDHLRARSSKVWQRSLPERRAVGGGQKGERRDLWLPGGNQAVYRWFYPTDWESGDDHRHYIERLVALAADQGATVVWLMTPIGSPIQAEWEALDLDARYTRFAATIQSSFANLIVIDGRKLPLGSADRDDPLHLSRQGAEAFTARVADLLGQLPSEPRWITMKSTGGLALD